MESKKEEMDDLRESLLEAEQEVHDFEEEMWNRLRGRTVHYTDHSFSDLEYCYHSAMNNYNYLVSCWESDFEGEDW